MTLRPATIAFIILLGSLPALADKPAYPPTRVEPVTDELHGVKIVDPYRWLEDDKSPEVSKWIESQVRFTAAYFGKIGGRNELAARLDQLVRVPTQGGLSPYQKRYFFAKRDPQQNQSVIYVRSGAYDAEPQLVLDPNTFSSDGTVAMDWYYPSHDGGLIAYGKSAGGSENSTLYVLDVATRKPLSEEIPGTKFCSLAWTADGKGFYYTRYPQPGEVAPGDENYYNHLYYHPIGGDWRKDPKLWGQGEPKEKRAGVDTSSDHRKLFMLTMLDWAKNDLYVRDLSAKPDAPFAPIAVGLNARTSGDFLGERLLLLTNHNAPRYRVVEADLARPGPEHWKDVVPQQTGVIQEMSIIGGRLVLTLLENVCSRIVIHDGGGKQVDEIKLPTLGVVSGVRGNHDGDDLFFAFESFAYPPTSFRYNLATRKLEELFRVPIDIRPEQYVTEQVWFNSKDGTRVPMFVVHKKGLKLDGSNPCLIYGYGGFNISSTPRFRNGLFVWLDKGGVYAVANIRGGGEFGAEWHHAGRLDKKQNCFDDFIYAAKALCEKGYSNPRRLAAWGGSNGGLLMGAMITQAPEQFRAIICAVPLLDMIRYHQFSMARFWIQEYGSSENPEQFQYILKYSPYHNVREAEYPAVLIETGESDGRVDPVHARKMAALLQAKTTSTRPILLRYETKAGHGAGKPISKIVEAQTDEWSFLMNELGVR